MSEKPPVYVPARSGGVATYPIPAPNLLAEADRAIVEKLESTIRAIRAEANAEFPCWICIVKLCDGAVR